MRMTKTVFYIKAKNDNKLEFVRNRNFELGGDLL